MGGSPAGTGLDVEASAGEQRRHHADTTSRNLTEAQPKHRGSARVRARGRDG